MSILLEARDVERRYHLRGGRVLQAVAGVSLHVARGEALALVGESGCGKSTLGRALVGLNGVSAGSIRFEGQEITALSERRMRPLRARMQMVFQDSYASLNPRRMAGDAIAEPLRIHRRPDIAARVRELLDWVGLPETAAARYPHEFSGGQRQRLNIARAIALGPSLLVADEPVSALDVSVQAQIINLFRDLQARLGLACVFISHDLAVVRQMADRIAVMYLGTIVEEGEGLAVMAAPAHPYTRALLEAVPRPDRPLPPPLAGEVPSPISPPPGCRFHTRCPIAQARCRAEVPKLREIGVRRSVACHFPLHEG
ncbi:peptide ABC transporter ATP-binding protein [Neoasaia chiangmaiensis NBRC 101099]|uniref:ABC transporter ATP-binding protein n=1 Tax=Neoasaia chiangmaiensis TaxID=320497 RepID=A0A1U9KPC2_9PROT|nr:ABC transporter ATP-binding protein [Neoasaia chiangmaiensis]AQS87652.1 ABC transporter ATP-binding protein [Neoasaia chiangmaiensis]GBR41970.1 peptide ABC transporter ATP-binding protein [Neoasaia chiangmaiensis NBRC 101099]GEN14228.1 ABC transporter ATP-binding protein [Neoasaia chiangmaiensis]